MQNKRTTPASRIALGGLLAALAVIIMCLGTMIPAATYAAPILCMHLCCIIRDLCGNRTAWAWYGAVAILGLLMAPDKEAAGVFLALEPPAVSVKSSSMHPDQTLRRFPSFDPSS